MMIKYAPLIILLLLMSNDAHIYGEQIAYEDITAKWLNNGNAIKTIDVVYQKIHFIKAKTRMGRTMQKGLVYPKEDLTLIYNVRFVLDEDKFRYEQQGEQWDNRLEIPAFLSRVVSFDGNNYYSLLSGLEDTDEAYAFGSIMGLDAKVRANSAVRQPDILPIVHSARPLHSRFPTELHRDWTALPGQELIEGIKCHALLADVIGSKYRIWIDDNYRLIRSDIIIEDNLVLSTFVNYNDSGEIDYIPSRWITKQYTPRTGELAQSFTMSRESLIVNKEVEPGEFTLEYPEGAMVTTYLEDPNQPERYIVKKGGKRLVTQRELSRNPTYTQLLNSESGDANIHQAKILRSSNNRFFVVAINLVMLLLVLAIVYARKTRAFRPK